VGYLRALVTTNGNLAALLTDTGKTNKAAKAYREILDLVQRAVRVNPKEQDYRVMEMQARLGYGRFLNVKGEWAKAESVLSGAVKLAEKLAADYPNTPIYRQHLGGAWRLLGNALTRSEPEKAIGYVNQGIKTAEKLVAEFPSVPDYQCELGGFLNNLAMLNHRLGRYEPARKLLEKAIVHQEEAVRQNPKNRHYRDFLKNHVANLALTLEQLKVPAAELDKVRRRAIELARGMAKDHPEVPDYQGHLGLCLLGWARVLHKRGQSEQALKVLQEALPYQQKALEASPKHPLYLGFVRDHYILWARVLTALKRPEAVQAWRKGLQLAREAVLLSPGKDNRNKLFEALHGCASANIADLFVETRQKGVLPAGKKQEYTGKMQAGRTYVIDLESRAFAPSLDLQDSTGKALDGNDGISDDDLNARIIHTAQTTGTYRIYVSSFRPGQSGAYVLRVRELLEK
jgi:tetratricopeptide (TPR) repeat protein